MKLHLKILSAAWLSFLLYGCVDVSYTSGTAQLNRDLVEKSLVKGKTTMDQVRALLGEPKSVVMSSGSPFMPAETWTYQKVFHEDANKTYGGAQGALYTAATGSYYGRTHAEVLIVSFDRNGRVIMYTFSSAG